MRPSGRGDISDCRRAHSLSSQQRHWATVVQCAAETSKHGSSEASLSSCPGGSAAKPRCASCWVLTGKRAGERAPAHTYLLQRPCARGHLGTPPPQGRIRSPQTRRSCLAQLVLCRSVQTTSKLIPFDSHVLLQLSRWDRRAGQDRSPRLLSVSREPALIQHCPRFSTLRRAQAGSVPNKRCPRIARPHGRGHQFLSHGKGA